MGSFESSEMEIVAYGRSCAEAIFGSPGCHLFNTSHLDLCPYVAARSLAVGLAVTSPGRLS
jgi:hypothetical protein